MTIDDPATKGDLQELESRLTGRIDGLESRMDRFETRLDGFETKLDRFETKMDRFEEKLGDFESMVKAGFEQIMVDIRDALSLGDQVQDERVDRHEQWIQSTDEADLPNRVTVLETVIQEGR